MTKSCVSFSNADSRSLLSFFDGERSHYTAKQWDEDAGLYYFSARWYDPNTARFITEDPIRDGLLWYAYCNNNPLKFTDPTGLRPARGTNADDEDKTRKDDEEREEQKREEEEKEQKREERREYLEEQKQELNDSFDTYRDIADDLVKGDLPEAVKDLIGIDSIEDIPFQLESATHALSPVAGAMINTTTATAKTLTDIATAKTNSKLTDIGYETPQKNNRSGRKQYWDPSSGHYKNEAFAQERKSNAVRDFAVGASQGFADEMTPVSDSILPKPVSPAQSLGQSFGSGAGKILNLFLESRK